MPNTPPTRRPAVFTVDSPARTSAPALAPTPRYSQSRDPTARHAAPPETPTGFLLSTARSASLPDQRSLHVSSSPAASASGPHPFPVQVGFRSMSDPMPRRHLLPEALSQVPTLELARAIGPDISSYPNDIPSRPPSSTTGDLITRPHHLLHHPLHPIRLVLPPRSDHHVPEARRRQCSYRRPGFGGAVVGDYELH